MGAMLATIIGGLSNIAIAISIAFTALRTNLMRSILTTIGVMIGVLAVILAVALGQGAKSAIVDSIGSLGSNMAIIFPTPDTGNGPPRRSTDRGRLTERDANAIGRFVPGVLDIAPQLRSSVQIVSAGRNASTSAIGITSGYGRVTNANVDFGRFISEADVRSGARVATLGPQVATKLFGAVSPLGQQIRINKVPFTVVGVLESKGEDAGGNQDDVALVPITTARQRFAATSTGPDDLSALYVGFESEEALKVGKKEIVRLLHDRNRVSAGEINPFTVRTTEEFLETAGQVTGFVQALLVGIASISLLVGGIGIMNIMLVSVTERTREIGLRMALGAKKRDIRNQFLVEAAVLCVIGGVIGLGLAAIIGHFLEPVVEFAVPIGLGTTLFAILFSATIGLIFGGYPAIRASRLSPIEALRSE